MDKQEEDSSTCENNNQAIEINFPSQFLHKKRVSNISEGDFEEDEDIHQMEIKKNITKISKFSNFPKKQISPVQDSQFRFDIHLNPNVNAMENPSHNSKDYYVSLIKEKIGIVNDLTNQIHSEVSKVVICSICKRKFANKAHYLRHSTLSKLHRANLNKINKLLTS